jgi:hypothetical protein
MKGSAEETPRSARGSSRGVGHKRLAVSGANSVYRRGVLDVLVPEPCRLGRDQSAGIRPTEE